VSDIDDLLAAARLPETTVPVCLRGDLAAEVEELERQLATQEAIPRVSIADGGQARATAERIAELQAEMDKFTRQFRLRAMDRHRWTAFILKHPPRQGDEADVRMGYNRDTLLPELVRTCLVDPVLTDDQWAKLDAVLSDAQFDSLATAAWGINRRDVSVPFSPTASRILRSAPE
jgi:hypothetical protein